MTPREALSPLIGYWNIIHLVLILLDIALVFIFIFYSVKVFSYRPHFIHKPKKDVVGKKQFLASMNVTTDWNKILKIFKDKNPEALKLAVINADSLVDKVLKNMNLAGESFADRLIGLNELDLKSLEGVWRAHKVRNELVHTPHLILSENDTKKALREYRDFLNEVGVLENNFK